MPINKSDSEENEDEWKYEKIERKGKNTKKHRRKRRRRKEPEQVTHAHRHDRHRDFAAVHQLHASAHFVQGLRGQREDEVVQVEMNELKKEAAS